MSDTKPKAVSQGQVRCGACGDGFDPAAPGVGIVRVRGANTNVFCSTCMPKITDLIAGITKSPS